MKNLLVKTDNFNIFEKKIRNIQHIIHKTILSTQKYKVMEIIGTNEINICIVTLEQIYHELNLILKDINNVEDINKCETNTKINNLIAELVIIFKNFGTETFSDLILLLINSSYIEDYFSDNPLNDKFNVINCYVHPINFKTVIWKHKNEKGESNKKVLQKNKIVEDYMICESAENLECFDLARTSKSFQSKVYGIKVALHDYKNKKTHIVAAIVDDILLSCFNNNYLQNRLLNLNNEKPNDPEFIKDYWERFLNSLSLKEILVYNNSEIYNKFQIIINQLQLLKQKTISQIVKEFINSELFSQRTVLIQLLIKSSNSEFQYLAYLLYDLLSNENNGSVDTNEQNQLYDSFPWVIKRSFRDAMKETIQYTNNLSNFDNNKIPLEQQICLLKADDSVKEKAILKLKEIKAKSEDSGSKARQYLDGLLKIPFNIYREEKILTIMGEAQNIFGSIKKKLSEELITSNIDLNIELKEKYTNFELSKYLIKIENEYIPVLKNKNNKDLIKIIKSLKKDKLNILINYLNNNIKLQNHVDDPKKFSQSNKKNSDLQEYIISIINSDNNVCLVNNMFNLLDYNNNNDSILKISDEMVSIQDNMNNISKYMTSVTDTLDNAIYGHKKAKRQIERIIGQWINGEKSGYCFGFEGPPGVGKTSLAKKGISNCLKDENGNSRPFAFIAVGGSSNGSTLEGHNYTYVGSTWGKIVDILIETKCMNPIIFIDELDKISMTEHGKEIIGILTHLIDSTQNDSFQDKYFSGIDLNLSKALFIFSYNDVDRIDRILLDRIHRIRFKHLSLDEKLTITNKYILPEIFEKMGLDNIIKFTDKEIEFIINTYTHEPGVRKLKELLFEIIGEINLTLLSSHDCSYNIPIEISIDEIKNKYLRERHEHKIRQKNDDNKVGIINGLWANGIGQGGVLQIEAKFFPSGKFLDLELTGMQGDVMKESMTVAKTLAWELQDEQTKKEIQEKFEKMKYYGVHIHVPEGATPKDGPSGGGAITTVIYSILSNKKINKDFAITGEICLQGKITAIGGLDLKIMGGLKSGINKFIYPKENQKDFDDYYEGLTDKSIVENVKFYAVDNIKEVLELIFVD